MVEIGYTFLSHLHQFYCMNWQPQCNRKKLLRLKVKAIIYYKGNEAQSTFFFIFYLKRFNSCINVGVNKDNRATLQTTSNKDNAGNKHYKTARIKLKRKTIRSLEVFIGIEAETKLPNQKTNKQKPKNQRWENSFFFLKSFSTTPWDQVAVT